jgi:hypothetical protein
MTPRSTGVSPASELETVRLWFEHELEARLAPLSTYVAALAALALPKVDRQPDKSPLTAGDVESLLSIAQALIEDSPTTIGAGFIAAPAAVDALDRYMLWLQRRNGVVRRLRLNFDTADINAYDYVAMDWYVDTRDRGRPSLTGPYLDYSGSDALVLTLATPVIVDDEFVGLVAVDLMAQATEELMTAQLCQLPGEVVVVNRDRTIVATNSARLMPGERLATTPGDDPDPFASVLPIAEWTDWQLVAPNRTNAD